MIKALTGDEKMLPENHLFATLDVTAHGGLLPNKMTVVYMDTVGFISNLHHRLIDAFSASLEDALGAVSVEFSKNLCNQCLSPLKL